ncbi:TPA: hypothetical protein MH263_27865 [Klebsiella pneumoniae]|nr:hypothetical protein [Klebsiella pneumoniae]HBX4616800.1 hypothetical protein [Klebsiella pneumoniae]
MHEIACVFDSRICEPAPALARLGASDPPALKPTHKAGRRGGESTARQTTFTYLFSQPERVAVPCEYARVSVGDAGAFEAVAGF